MISASISPSFDQRSFGES